MTTPHDNPLRWSAFGANYIDTVCQDGFLVDLDSLDQSDTPCPFCNPRQFFDIYWEADEVSIICDTCKTEFTPDDIIFIDGPALTWHVVCATCNHVTRARIKQKYISN